MDAPIRTLSTGQEQMVQIAAAVGTGARALVFDEPTSSLSEPEAQKLFAMIEQIKQQGVTMIYISHRLPELFRLCDRLSVLRDGQYVGTLNRSDMTEDRVVQMMIGRTVQPFQPRFLAQPAGPVVLKVQHLTSPGRFADVSFEVRAGEIVGFAGLVGSGRSEISQTIFDLDAQAFGSIELHGQPLPLHQVRRAMRRRIGLWPEDRKRQGLVLELSCRENFSLAMLRGFSRWGWMQRRREEIAARELAGKLNVKTVSLEVPVAALSGGNQQKVALAKWLVRQSKLLLVDEPTRGVDVGAVAAIHEILDNLATQGVAILLISSELPELLTLSGRILVMRQGQLVGQLNRADASQDRVLRLMAGVGTDAGAG